jgi:glycosyltransferase involved in cell wall biosynthesis
LANKIGGLIPCWNEEACIAFSIGAIIDHVDELVVVDSGSTDKTVQIVKQVFDSHIKSGKLILVEFGPLPDFDVSKPKNKGIEILREKGCDFILHVDADDIFYDGGAKRLVSIGRDLGKHITHFTVNQHELYQHQIDTTAPWLDRIEHEIKSGEYGVFLDMRIPPATFQDRTNGSYGHARLFNIQSAISTGKWTDENAGLPGEGIKIPGLNRVCIGNPDEFMAHYGWARPLNKKKEKGRVWNGEGRETADIRVFGLHERWAIHPELNVDRFLYGIRYWPQTCMFQFNRHPEVFGRLIGPVREIVRC